jgi:hypothetical protein
MNKLIADIIYIIHSLIVLFVLFGGILYSNDSGVLILHITFAISLIVHWYANSDMCSLTILESQLRGAPIDQTFSHKIISPIYNISKTDSNKIAYFVTFIVLFLSIYFLIHTTKWKEFLKCWEDKPHLRVTGPSGAKCFMDLFTR